MKFTNVIRAVSVAGLLAVIPSIASANTLSFAINTKFAGTPQSPTATALFDDNTGAANTVNLTLTSLNTVDNDTITEWYFNFNPLKDVTALTFAYDVASTGPNLDASPGLGQNDYKADGGGNFDIFLSWPNSGTTFNEGQSVMFLVTSSAGAIDVSDFAFLDDGTGGAKGPYGSAIKNSAYWADPTTGVEVPVPSSLAGLLGLALTVGGVRFWKIRTGK